jgi:hypothetical protein
MGKGDVHEFCLGNRTERRHLEHPVTEGWITLKQIFKKYEAGQGLDYLLQDRHMAGNSKHGEALGLMKCAEFVDFTTVSFSRRNLLHAFV